MHRKLTLAALAVAFTLAGGMPVSLPGFTGNGAAFAQATDEQRALVPDMVMGSAEAPVEVIEYASFTCPHCARFHQTVLGQLKADYIDTGKVRLVYREVYFDRYGLWAAMVARCGGAEKYFGIAGMLYEKQREWAAGSDPAAIAENLRTLGKTAGLTEEQLGVCLNDAEQAQAMVAVYQENAKADDINSTPSFVINGKKYSNMNYEDFKAILDAQLGG